jgi:hypothetical protein
MLIKFKVIFIARTNVDIHIFIKLFGQILKIQNNIFYFNTILIIS